MAFLVLASGFGHCRIEECDEPDERRSDFADEWEVGRAETQEEAQALQDEYIRSIQPPPGLR
jgi:hypothetical protein